MKMSRVELATQEYWKYSRIWKGHNSEVISVSTALRHMEQLLCDINPLRPVYTHLDDLQMDVICNNAG